MQKILQDKKILVTGLTGRIGHAVAERFAPNNEVWGLARYGREGSMDEAKALGAIPIKGDYARSDLVGVPSDFDYVLHIAADIAPKCALDAMIDNSDGPARLMKHCRNAKAFMHVSATGVYKQSPDPMHLYKEDEDLGGSYGGQYIPSKIAAEGAVRAAALILDLPTVICRQNVQYGGPMEGGLIDTFIAHFIASGEVFLPPEGPLIIGPIHEDDICDLIEPCLAIASVPAEIINWGGDELVDWEELFEYVGMLIGKKPKFIRKADFAFPNCYPDPSKRRSIAGNLKVRWKDGIRRSLNLRHPQVKLNNFE